MLRVDFYIAWLLAGMIKVGLLLSGALLVS